MYIYNGSTRNNVFQRGGISTIWQDTQSLSPNKQQTQNLRLNVSYDQPAGRYMQTLNVKGDHSVNISPKGSYKYYDSVAKQEYAKYLQQQIIQRQQDKQQAFLTERYLDHQLMMKQKFENSSPSKPKVQLRLNEIQQHEENQKKQETLRRLQMINEYNQHLAKLKIQQPSGLQNNGIAYPYFQRNEETEKIEKQKQMEAYKKYQEDLKKQIDESKKLKEKQGKNEKFLENIKNKNLSGLMGQTDHSEEQPQYELTKNLQNNSLDFDKVKQSLQKTQVKNINDSKLINYESKSDNKDQQIVELKLQMEQNEKKIQNQIKDILEFTIHTMRHKDRLDTMKNQLIGFQDVRRADTTLEGQKSFNYSKDQSIRQGHSIFVSKLYYSKLPGENRSKELSNHSHLYEDREKNPYRLTISDFLIHLQPEEKEPPFEFQDILDINNSRLKLLDGI